MLLASCNVCNIKMWLHQHFYTYWEDNIISETKQTEQTRTERHDQIWWISHTLLRSPSVVTSIKYVCYLYDQNKSASSVNELWCRIFTKKNSSKISFTTNFWCFSQVVLVLHLRRALAFFHQYLFNIFSELFFIYQKYKM